jgi:hypothetical protein
MNFLKLNVKKPEHKWTGLLYFTMSYLQQFNFSEKTIHQAFDEKHMLKSSIEQRDTKVFHCDCINEK